MPHDLASRLNQPAEHGLHLGVLAFVSGRRAASRTGRGAMIGDLPRGFAVATFLPARRSAGKFAPASSTCRGTAAWSHSNCSFGAGARVRRSAPSEPRSRQLGPRSARLVLPWTAGPALPESSDCCIGNPLRRPEKSAPPSRIVTAKPGQLPNFSKSWHGIPGSGARSRYGNVNR